MMKGSCLCESVRYEITGELGPVYNCHCSKCRRWHGAVYRTRASILKAQFIWLCGEDNLSAYASSDNVTKFFCKTCGSPLISTYKNNPAILGIPLGGIEGIDDLKVQAHIFVGSKAPWFDINDEIRQFEGWPDSEANVRATAPENNLRD